MHYNITLLYFAFEPFVLLSCWFADSQQELDGRRLLSTAGVRRKKLTSPHSAAADDDDSDTDDEDDEDEDEDDDDRLTDINDCCCQLCMKTCFLSAVSLHSVCRYDVCGWAWHSGNTLCRVNEVTLRRAR